MFHPFTNLAAFTTAAALTLSFIAPSSTNARQTPVGDEISTPTTDPIGPDDVSGGEVPPLEVIHVETDTGFGEMSTQGTVLFAETTAPTGSTPPGWLLRVDLTVRNNGGEAVEVTALGITTDVSALSVQAFEESIEIAPNDTELMKPHDITGSGTPPKWFTVNVYAPAAAPYPAQATYQVDIYENNTSTGGYRFPARADDLPAGVFWTPGEVHAHSRGQRYAYDFKAVRWDHDLGAWTFYTEQAYEDAANGIDLGSKNEHHLIWGQPVYAMASGWTARCRRSQPDHLPGKANSVPGANSINIDHGNGEHSAVAHLMQYTMPVSLCPAESPVTDDDPAPAHVPVYVEEGQFLGLVGNSGPSTGPHVHIHVVDGGPEVSASKVRGLPLNFHDVFVRTYVGYDPTVDPADWNWVTTAESAAIGRKQLIHPNSCGWETDHGTGGFTTTNGGRAPERIRECDRQPDPLERPVPDPEVRIPVGADEVTVEPAPRTVDPLVPTSDVGAGRRAPSAAVHVVR